MERVEEMIKDHECRIRDLEGSQRETVVYVKEIKADLKEIKEDIKKIPREDIKSDKVNPIIIELIRLLGTTITIIGAIAGFKAIGG